VCICDALWQKIQYRFARDGEKKGSRVPDIKASDNLDAATKLIVELLLRDYKVLNAGNREYNESLNRRL